MIPRTLQLRRGNDDWRLTVYEGGKLELVLMNEQDVVARLSLDAEKVKEITEAITEFQKHLEAERVLREAREKADG